MYSDDTRIRPYIFKGLKGRYIYYPPRERKLTRTFLLVYGQHASIERCSAVVEALSRFGEVYLVDTPGFGGMDPSYKIGQYPSLPFYGEHIKHVLDTIIPKDKKVTLFGISFGMEILSQFLAEYPSYHNRVQDTISFVGLASYRDFRISPKLRFLLRNLVTGPGRTWIGSKIYKHLIFRDVSLRIFYYFYIQSNPRFMGTSPSERWQHAKEQSWLWRINDPRTHGATAWDFLFKTDMTNLRINLPIIHLGVPDDHYLDNTQVIADLKKMYSSVKVYDLNLSSHAPVAFDEAKKILEIIPEALQNYLLKSN